MNEVQKRKLKVGKDTMVNVVIEYQKREKEARERARLGKESLAYCLAKGQARPWSVC